MSIDMAESPDRTSQPLIGEVVPENDSQDTHPIAAVLRQFLREVDDYREAVNIAMPAIYKRRHDEIDKVLKKLNSFEGKKLDNGKTEYTFNNPHAAREFLNATLELDRLVESRLPSAVARSLFIGLFSAYDSFIGSLLKTVYLSKPVLFKGIKREISLSDLLEFEDLGAVKKDMLEKEIDSIRRESYVTQFVELERKFELRTLREFPEWPRFIEMSQRRNLMTHNDGRVTDQYLNTCDREGYKFEKRPAFGERLELAPAYVRVALLIVGKVGFMLAHTLWRKILPNDLAAAHDAMNDEIYDLLARKRWITATEFGKFGLTEPMLRDAPDIGRRIRVVNTAIALKQSKRGAEAIKLLEEEDWSACVREFKLAVAVLKEEFQEAAILMRDIGKKGELINQFNYHQWPLFENFRNRPEFQDAYEAIYGVPFMQKASEQAHAKAAVLREEVPAYPDPPQPLAIADSGDLTGATVADSTQRKPSKRLAKAGSRPRKARQKK